MVCGAKCEAFKVTCTLPAGHDWPHVHENDTERISWEPKEMAQLRRENERLKGTLAIIREAPEHARDHANAALKAEPCGRLLVGQGSDTYDPLCVRPAGHDGRCQAAASEQEKS